MIHREGDPIAAAQALVKTGFTGAVIEGNFDDYSLMIIGGTLARAKMFYLESGPRSRVRFDGERADRSTSQGMWPGIHVEKGSTATRGPDREPVDRHQHRLHPLRPRCHGFRSWIAVTPPPKNVTPCSGTCRRSATRP